PLLAGDDPSASLRALMAARADAYAEAHAKISTEARGVDEVARDVVARWNERSIAVALGARSYVVRFVDAAATAIVESVNTIDHSSIAVVTDANVDALHGSSALAMLRDLRSPLARVVLP